MEDEWTDEDCFWDRDDEQFGHCHYPCCHCTSCPEHEEYVTTED